MDWLAKIGSDIAQVVGQSPTSTDGGLSPNAIEPYKELRFRAEKPERHLACLEHTCEYGVKYVHFGLLKGHFSPVKTSYYYLYLPIQNWYISICVCYYTHLKGMKKFLYYLYIYIYVYFFLFLSLYT